MSYITGLLLIDAPASALNNGQGEETKGKVKSIYVRGQGDFPYVSAQSFRFWLRNAMATQYPNMEASPVYSAGAGKKQQAFTKGDPIQFWDDDILGYMRAEKGETVTRVSPLRVSTVVSLAPVQLVDDFGVMSRVPKQAGDKEGVLLHGHEFYRTTLQALFSFDLARVGTFTDVRRTGYQNLGEETKKAAQQNRLSYLEPVNAYRMDSETRVQRVQATLRSLARLEGGAKQTLHYTDVSPALVIAAVTKGGNHLFGHTVKVGSDSKPYIHSAALEQALSVFAGDLLSPLYVGRAQGFMDESASVLEKFADNILHPREALDKLADDVALHNAWLE